MRPSSEVSNSAATLATGPWNSRPAYLPSRSATPAPTVALALQIDSSGERYYRRASVTNGGVTNWLVTGTELSA